MEIRIDEDGYVYIKEGDSISCAHISTYNELEQKYLYEQSSNF